MATVDLSQNAFAVMGALKKIHKSLRLESLGVAPWDDIQAEMMSGDNAHLCSVARSHFEPYVEFIQDEYEFNDVDYDIYDGDCEEDDYEIEYIEDEY